MKIPFLVYLICMIVSQKITAQDTSSIDSMRLIAPKPKIVNQIQLDSVIHQSECSYKIVLFYNYWCQSSWQNLPPIMEYCQNHNEQIQLILIAGELPEKIGSLQGFLSMMKFYDTTYLLDIKDYGKRKNPFSRIDKCVEAICPSCNPKKMGYTAYIVFDKNDKVIFSATYELDGKQKVDAIKSLDLIN